MINIGLKFGDIGTEAPIYPLNGPGWAEKPYKVTDGSM